MLFAKPSASIYNRYYFLCYFCFLSEAVCLVSYHVDEFLCISDAHVLLWWLLLGEHA